jgi:Flp pilus assembly protein TadG
MPVKLRHICNHCSTHDQNGNAMIEMAIVLPIFIFLFVAIVDFGLYFNTKNVAQSAAWNGAKECVEYSAGVYESTAIAQATTAIVKATLEPLLSTSDLAAVTAGCSAAGGGTYWRTSVSVPGNMLSPFTTALGLYPITAVGIAN